MENNIFFKKINLLTYPLLILIFLLPPFYIIPIKHELWSSHILAGIMSLSLFLYKILNKQTTQIIKTQNINIFLLLYFLSQSLSILNASNIIQFISLYKNLVLAMILYIVARSVIMSARDIKIILYTVIISFIINLVLNVTLFLKIEPYYNYLINNFFTRSTSLYIIASLGQNKLFFQAFVFSCIPVLFYIYAKSQNLIKKLMIFLVFALALITANLTNFRIILFVIMFGSITSFLLFRKVIQNWFLIPVTLILVTSGFLYKSSTSRIILPAESDFQTIESRLSYWNEAFTIGSSNLLGVGLGNYYDNLAVKFKNDASYYLVNEKNWRKNVLESPHNVFFSTFAETGSIGFLAYFILLIGLIKYDFFSKNSKSKYLNKSILFAFWSLVLFGLTNPTYTIQFWMLFFLFRILLEKANNLEENKKTFYFAASKALSTS